MKFNKFIIIIILILLVASSISVMAAGISKEDSSALNALLDLLTGNSPTAGSNTAKLAADHADTAQATVAGTGTATTTPTATLTDLQNQINKDTLNYYNCFIDGGAKCNGVPSALTNNFGGTCKNYIDAYYVKQNPSDTKNKYDLVQSYDSIITDKSAKPEQGTNLSSMKDSLTKAFITAESNWNKEAINKKLNNLGQPSPPNQWSFGLMQSTAENLKNGGGYFSPTLQDFFGIDTGKANEGDNTLWSNPSNNIARGTTLYKYYAQKNPRIVDSCKDKGSIVLQNIQDLGLNWQEVIAIGAYNAGQGNSNCEDGIVPSTTKTYVPEVLAWAKIFNQNKCEIAAQEPENEAIVEVVPKTPTQTNPASCGTNENPTCNDVLTCLACIDGKFLNGVFK